MKINVTKEGSVVKVVVAFEKEEWVEAQNKAYNKLGKDVVIDGFRKGHAPLDKVKKAIDPQKMLDEAINILVPKGFEQTMKENPMEVLVRPDVGVNKVSLDELELVYTITVRPEIKLGKYQGIEVIKDFAIASDDEINASLEEIRQRCAEMSPKEDAIVKGDIVQFDFEGFIDGKPFDGGKAEKYELEIGSNRFVPGFEDQLVGMKKGDDGEIKVRFPKDYVKDLADKEATFKIKIHEVNVKNLPEINDDLALDANIDGVNNLEELRNHVITDIQNKKQHDADNKALNELIDKIIADVEVDVPSTLVDADTEENFKRYQQDIEQKGIPFDKYLEITNNTVEKIKEQIKGEATKNLKTFFVLSAIAKENNIEVKDEDIEAEMKKIADQYHMELEKVKELMKDRVNELANHIYSQKINDFLISVNKLV